MSSEKPIVGAGESSPATDGSEREGVVVECEAIDEEDDSENIAVLNDLPRHWIGKRVRVTLIPNEKVEAPNEGSLRRLVRRFHLRLLKRFLCAEMMRMNTDTIGFRVTLRDGTLAEWHIKLIRVSEPNFALTDACKKL